MKVKFTHCRNIIEDQIQPNGGLTLAYIVNDDYKVIGYAPAKCHEKDHFNRKLGRIKAEGRLKSPKYFVEITPMNEKEFISKAQSGWNQFSQAF